MVKEIYAKSGKGRCDLEAGPIQQYVVPLLLRALPSGAQAPGELRISASSGTGIDIFSVDARSRWQARTDRPRLDQLTFQYATRLRYYERGPVMKTITSVGLILVMVMAVAAPLQLVIAIRIETLDAVVLSIRHIDLARV